jgi:hypothetical protein
MGIDVVDLMFLMEHETTIKSPYGSGEFGLFSLCFVSFLVPTNPSVVDGRQVS